MAEARDRPRSTLDWVRIAVPVAIGIILIAFALANRHDVTVDFLVTQREAALIVVILVSAALGAIAGALALRQRGRPR